MRSLCAGAAALLAIVISLSGQAAAQPPVPPGLPLPGLPVLPPPTPANGTLLPDIQQWIDRVLPPPPISAAPQPIPAGQTDDLSPELAALRQAV
ncbi:MAG: lipase, partial [Nocardia sp.]|nr:lipase [Nocardia sp.]